jgi:hypothetical protein
MKTLCLSVFLLILMPPYGASAQQTASVAERACRGETSAVTELEEHGDSEELRRMMHDPDCSFKTGARFTLAKRGDREALQFYACRSLTDKVAVMDELLRSELPGLGGEFAIQVYRQLLDSDKRFEADRESRRRPTDDFFVLPYSEVVPSLLHDLLPEAGVPALAALQVHADGKEMADAKAKWRSWIDDHHDLLLQMRPTAEEVSFQAEACTDVADISTLERRLKTIAGEHAHVCGPQNYDDNSREATNRCVRKAVAEGKTFYSWQVLQGSVVWNVAAGIAGDGQGNVFMILFDDSGASRAGLGNDVEVLDNGASVVARCPHPIKLRKAISGNLTCITRPGSLLLSPH